MDIERIEPGAFISQAVAFNGMVWLSGLVTRGDGAVQSADLQARDILEQLDSLLAKAGSAKDRLLWTNIWLVDIGDWAAVNEVWIRWLDGAAPPARASVQAMLHPPYRVEIAVVAARSRLAA